ncbi:MAG: malectin domain-containing carbohydrate-binding protein [Bacteroidota bacterium]
MPINSIFERIACLFLLLLLSAPFSSFTIAQSVEPVREGAHNPGAPLWGPRVSQMEWTSLQDALEPRVEGHSAVIDGKIYVFGGFQTQDIVPTDKNEVYNIDTNAWSTFAPLPIPNTHVGSAEADGKVWIAGGYALIGFIQTVDIVWIYDPVANTFTNGPSLPAPRAGGALVRLGRKLHYISGLENRNDSVGDHFVLDLDEPGGPQTWTTAAPMPDPRNHFSGIALGGKIYAIGGQFNHDIDPVDTNLVHEYDPETDAWTRKADLPYIRSHFEPGTIAVDGKIVIVGGRTGTQNCVDTITEYDPVANQWAELFTMPDCLLAPSAKVIDDEMIVSHGGKVSVLFPTTATRKTEFERSPSTSMQFSPTSYTVSLAPGETATVEPLLWTLTDEAAYTINLAGLPSWISNVSKNTGTADVAADEIDITLNTTGLAPGVYSHTLTATASGYNDATLTLQVTVAGDGEALLAFSPASIDLGAVAAGDTHAQTLTLTNTGSGTATFSLSGAELVASALNLTYSGAAVDVMLRPEAGVTQLAPGASATVDMYITMLESGAVTGSGSFPYFSDGDETSVGLSFSATASGTRIARINAGSTTTISPGVFAVWDEDQLFESGKTFSNDAVTLIDGTLDQEPYKSERSALTNLGSFAYRIPVPAAGHYIARLHFAETFFGAPGGSIDFIGRRVFDVNLEGGPVELDDYDIAAEVGPVTAVVKAFTMEVLDGTLDIEFEASVDQPKVSAIEVFQVDQTIQQALFDGWNLISLPTTPTDAAPTSIYADIDLVQLPFAYVGNSYVEQTSMAMGTGYWLKTAGNSFQSHAGTANTATSVALQDGWNIIGGATCASPLSSATGATSLLINPDVYGYSDQNGYSLVDVLQPGQGYWAEASGSGTVTFNCGAGKAKAHESYDQTIQSAENTALLTIEDARGYTRTLFIAVDASAEGQFRLPPTPPSNQVDVRFLNSSSLMDADAAVAKIQAMEAPLTFTLTGDDRVSGVVLSVNNGDDWEVVGELTYGTSTTVDAPDLSRLLVSKYATEAALPQLFTLQQAYPNPFQSAFTVSFDTPEDAVARIELYDMLGKRVLVSPSAPIPAGSQRTLQVTTSGLASGAYMYQLIVETPSGNHRATGQVVMIK